ncbi:MAG: hydantoinase/oxoprolinase family protein [Gammaproteobacteria bacterium]|nr:hydantoinase/oxoprolinase family protein [Gammaproteobacteria bacterium]
MGILVNIDNGGTFTDVCISDGDRVVHAKSPTTPHDLTQCFLEVLKRGSRELYGEDDAARLIREADCLRYSTTSGTNAVVEHKGTPVALLVDAGREEDVYGAIAGMGGNALWRAMVPQPPAGIHVGVDGSVDAGELTVTINRLLAQGALRLVVALSSAAAEQAVKAMLLDRYPRHLLGAIPFLISSELAEDADMARRTVTAVINSYLHPGMEHFLYGAENICKAQHLRRPLLIFRNDGDSARVAKTTAIKTWGSGPRGGLEGSLAYARHYDLDTLVAMDVGGTTTDISVVLDKGVKQLAYGEIAGAATSFALPTILSFGLGGSSVLRVANGALSIGPDSVGAAPGPACFGRGGTAATLTDALLVAGVLDAEKYLGGELKLDRARAEQAILANVATPLGLGLDAAVAHIVTTFEASVGRHVSEALAESGRAPAQATLLAFGGGGPMIAAGIAAAAGIKRVLIPRLSSVFSAFGIGFSHLAHEYQVPLQARDDVAALRGELRRRVERDMYGEGVDPGACRYDVRLWAAAGAHAVERELDGERYTLAQGEQDPRLTVRAVYELPTTRLAANDVTHYTPRQSATRADVNLDGRGAAALALVDDASLAPGDEVVGPALVRGSYLTSVIAAGWRLRVSSNGDLLVEGN